MMSEYTKWEAVLISIKSKWCELIASGKKTGEVRKTKPKLNTPFKAYIYCTKERSTDEILWTSGIIGKFSDKANGKIIGEFVCDKISEIRVFENGNVQDFFFDNLSNTCLTYDEISEYIGRDGIGYNWHISELVIYDKPRELGEFCCADIEAIKDCKHRFIMGQPEYYTKHGGWIKGSYGCCKSGETEWCEKCLTKPLRRPPQSWCYVKECERNERA